MSKLKQMENPPKKKASRSRVSVAADNDRISNLPDSLICHILSFLQMATVVATSILSKRWRFLWTKVTTLDFVYGRYEDEEVEEETIRVRKFVQFVNKVLLSINSQGLQKFRVEWLQYCYDLEPESVAKWISFAISRSIRVLFFDLGFGDDHLYDDPLAIHLPGTLFTCATLEVLKLYGYFVLEVPSAVCLPKLRVLHLRYLIYKSKECLPRLTLACPVLHTLQIGRKKVTDSMQDFRVSSPSLRRLQIFATEHDNECEARLEIDAPNLEYFSLSGRLKECLVKRVGSVYFAALDLDVFPFPDYEDAVGNDGLYIDRCNSTVKLVEAMNCVKSLILKGTVIRALSYATTTLTACFERLITLNVSVQCCHWSSLGAVLAQSTKLQVLKIAKVGYCENTDLKLCWNDPTKVPECLSSSLQKVSFFRFKGLEDEMEMIKYILSHGEVLESFTLKSNVYPSDYKRKYELLQHVATFSRCSRACQLHFD